MNYLVIIGGAGSNESSYRKLKKIAPDDWKIWVLPPFKLLFKNNFQNINIPLSEFFKENNLSKVYLLGHSLGGAIAIKFAHDKPDYIKQLVLVDSEGITSNETIYDTSLNFLKDGSINKTKALREKLSDLCKTLRNPGIYLKLAKLAPCLDMTESAKKIKVPTIILWGEKDLLVPLWKGKELHKLIAGSKLEVLKDMDHHWLLHSPELFWKQVK